ncbi:hypothetical protein L7F22_042680 [Adiantum nelumboides]|nr:hypothetical protein [Adiantum nelumboides]
MTGTEFDPQHLFVLTDLRELQREIGDGQCRHAGLGSIRRFLGSLIRMGVMDAQTALGGVGLCICDFSTNTRPDIGVGRVPSWNTYADDLAEAAFIVAYEFMVAGGVVIALCMPKQYITIVREAQDDGFELIRTMILFGAESEDSGFDDTGKLLILLFSLALASLSSNECGASTLQQTRYHSLGLHDPAGSLYWQVVRSRLRSGEAQEEEEDMLEALRELERGTHSDEAAADADSMLWKHSNEGKEEEVEEEGEEKEERHPADELLQSLQADATISYILGGY